MGCPRTRESGGLRELGAGGASDPVGEVPENHVGHRRASARNIALRAHFPLEDGRKRVLVGHVDVAKAMLEMCRALGASVLLACSSTSAHATGDKESLMRDLRKLALLAVPFGIRIAYEALSWGRHVNLLTQAWEIVRDADRSNLGVCIDSYHVLAHGIGAGTLDVIDPRKVFLVQLSDFLWQETRSPEDRMETARHYRVFPGEGVHSADVIALVRKLDDTGYRGDYSFEVFNDDYRQLPLPMVAARARRSVKWIAGLVSRRSLPARRITRAAGR
jgi:sugar phosphate isomerase/epimerase